MCLAQGWFLAVSGVLEQGEKTQQQTVHEWHGRDICLHPAGWQQVLWSRALVRFVLQTEIICAAEK